MVHMPNIDAISSALFTLWTQYEYSQTLCDEGARDGIDTVFGISGLLHISRESPWQYQDQDKAIAVYLINRFFREIILVALLSNA